MLVDLDLKTVVEDYVAVIPEDVEDTVRMLLLRQLIEMQMVLTEKLQFEITVDQTLCQLKPIYLILLEHWILALRMLFTFLKMLAKSTDICPKYFDIFLWFTAANTRYLFFERTSIAALSPNNLEYMSNLLIPISIFFVKTDYVLLFIFKLMVLCLLFVGVV